MVLLEADPDLGDGLEQEQFRLARAQSVVDVIELESSGWDPNEIDREGKEAWVGLFLVEGLMIRRVTVGQRAACELFGPGDLFRPWDSDGEYEPLPISVDWHVLKPTRLAVLDAAFSLRIVRWPSITNQIVGRVAQRARYLALTQAVTHLPRVYARLLIFFWLLAERWGRVRPEGVHVTLPLTHAVLAMMVGASRPAVTVALQRLSRAGLLLRERQDRWMLTNLAIERLGMPESLMLIDDMPKNR